MLVDHRICQAFKTAIDDPENINKDGSYNWDFVEADMYLDMSLNMFSIAEIHEGMHELIDMMERMEAIAEEELTMHEAAA